MHFQDYIDIGKVYGDLNDRSDHYVTTCYYRIGNYYRDVLFAIRIAFYRIYYHHWHNDYNFVHSVYGYDNYNQSIFHDN